MLNVKQVFFKVSERTILFKTEAPNVLVPPEPEIIQDRTYRLKLNILTITILLTIMVLSKLIIL